MQRIILVLVCCLRGVGASIGGDEESVLRFGVAQFTSADRELIRRFRAPEIIEQIDDFYRQARAVQNTDSGNEQPSNVVANDGFIDDAGSSVWDVPYWVKAAGRSSNQTSLNSSTPSPLSADASIIRDNLRALVALSTSLFPSLDTCNGNCSTTCACVNEFCCWCPARDADFLAFHSAALRFLPFGVVGALLAFLLPCVVCRCLLHSPFTHMHPVNCESHWLRALRPPPCRLSIFLLKMWFSERRQRLKMRWSKGRKEDVNDYAPKEGDKGATREK